MAKSNKPGPAGKTTSTKNDPGFIPEPFSGHYDQQVEDAWALRVPAIEARGTPLFALLDVLSSLVNNFHNHALKPLGHNYTEYAVLCTLLLHNEGLRPSVLTELLRHPSANTAQTLNKLESRGLVQREANPEDGRSVLVALTEAGRLSVMGLCESEAAASGRLVRDLSDGELEELRRAVGTLIALFSDT